MPVTKRKRKTIKCNNCEKREFEIYSIKIRKKIICFKCFKEEKQIINKQAREVLKSKEGRKE